MKEKHHAETHEQAQLQEEVHASTAEDESNQRATHHGAGRFSTVINRLKHWWRNPPDEQYEDRAY